MTLHQDNAARFATRAAEAIDTERHVGVRHVLSLILDGQRGRAEYELGRSLQRQAGLAGIQLGPTVDDLVDAEARALAKAKARHFFGRCGEATWSCSWCEADEPGTQGVAR